MAGAGAGLGRGNGLELDASSTLLAIEACVVCYVHTLRESPLKKWGVLLACAFVAGQAGAAAVAPAYDTFGNLAGATFGGSGIPTDPTAISTGGGITLGLTAHQRFANPPLTNDGLGTFTAQAGANDGTPGNPGTAATWNFAYYVDIGTDSFATTPLQFTLRYDLDPGVGTDESALGSLNLGAIAAFAGATNLFQDSQNATFGFLCTPIPGFITPPASCIPGFDPNVAGEYSFVLTASRSGVEVARSAILVNVAAVPEPGTLALLGIAMLGAAVTRRRV